MHVLTSFLKKKKYMNLGYVLKHLSQCTKNSSLRNATTI